MKIKTHYQLLKLITYSSLVLLFGSLHAQESDPFVKKEGIAIVPSQTTLGKSSKDKVMAYISGVQQSMYLMKVVSITFETFSLSAREADKLRRLNISDAKMYETVIKMVEENKAKQELFSTVRSWSGDRMNREATQAYRSDAKLETAESKTDAKASSKSESPEIKKSGFSMEVLVVMSDPGPFIPLTQKGATLLSGELRDFNANHTIPFSRKNLDNAAIEQKKKQFFEAVIEGDIKVMNRITSSFKYSFSDLLPPLNAAEGRTESLNLIHAEVILNAGDPFLFGTYTPASKLKENGNKEVWLSFVTGTLKTPGL